MRVLAVLPGLAPAAGSLVGRRGRQLHLFTAIGGKFEAAADVLKHASLLLRDDVLEDVIDG